MSVCVCVCMCACLHVCACLCVCSCECGACSCPTFILVCTSERMIIMHYTTTCFIKKNPSLFPSVCLSFHLPNLLPSLYFSLFHVCGCTHTCLTIKYFSFLMYECMSLSPLDCNGFSCMKPFHCSTIIVYCYMTTEKAYCHGL